MDYRQTVNLPTTDFPQRAQLAAREPDRLDRWERERLYDRSLERRTGAERFELHDGPPYSNGNIHVGTAMNKVLKDIVVRYRDLAGYQARFRPGWDNHGLPIELAVSRQFSERGVTPTTVELRHACRQYAAGWIDTQREQFRRLGVRADWDHPYLTMDHAFEADILATFAELAKQGYVYRGQRSVWWAPALRTALADAELEYHDHTSTSIYVPFRVTVPGAPFAGLEPAYVVIWTTTPWTIPSNLAIALHPDIEYRLQRVDGRVYLTADYLADSLAERFGWQGEKLAVLPGAAFEGVVCRHPLYERDSPIVFADYVTVSDGTGCVHTAPGHGKEDFETGQRYGLEPFCPVDEAGVYTAEVGGRLAGRKVLEADGEVVAWLREQDALLAVEPYVHSYPHDWRAREPVIVRATTQWFLNIDHPVGETTHRELALAAIDGVTWHPAEGHDRIKPMVAGRPDWCLSRQRAWGVGIPAFYCECGAVVMTPESLDSVVAKVRELGSDAWFELEPGELLPEGFACPDCGGAPSGFTKEQDVLDVWFDSGSTHRCCYGDDDLPVDVYLEGSDQHRGWFNSSLMVGVGLTGAAPYRHVVTHGFVLDADGRAMSKSLGNTVDPLEIIGEFGADVFRLWVASVDFFSDVRVGREILERVADMYRNIRNSFRFLLGNLHDFDPAADAVALGDRDLLGRWVLLRLEQLKQNCAAWFSDYHFRHVVGAVHQFVLDVSAVYLDVCKDELYCGAPAGPARRAIQTVLWTVCSELARVVAPVLCFTADEVWELLPGAAGSVHLSDWPTPRPERIDETLEAQVATLLDQRAAVKMAQEQYNQPRSKAERVNPLAMAVELTVPVGSPQFGDLLRELLVVSRATVVEGAVAAPTAVVAPADGSRCERCWRVWPADAFGGHAAHPTLCNRCAEVVEGAAP